jgi:DNA repair exonuclease SbcCD ATPase subunit
LKKRRGVPLNHQVQQIRTEYEKKIQTYRDELHRKFELEFHRYQMYKSRPIPMVTREHKHKLDQLKSERRTTEEQITSVRDSITKIQNQIGILDTQIVDIRPTSNSQENLAMLEQTIREREKQLDYVIRIRTELKQRIEKYRKEVDRYSKQPIEQSPVSTREKSIIRSSSTHDFTIGNYQQYQLSPSIYSLNSISLPSKQLAITQSGEKPLEEETFVRFSDFDVEQGLNLSIFLQENISDFFTCRL